MHSVKKHISLALILFVFFSCARKSGRRHNKQTVQTTRTSRRESRRHNKKHQHHSNYSGGETTIVKMTKRNGVYTIPIKVNGLKMNFIFDTGAGIVSISETEALFLYKQGKLTKTDFIKTSQFVDANGNISEGTIINLKTVQIGNRTLHNIRASVVHNLKAPLLLGQSVLEKFGKVSIDYENKQIILE